MPKTISELIKEAQESFYDLRFMAPEDNEFLEVYMRLAYVEGYRQGTFDEINNPLTPPNL